MQPSALRKILGLYLLLLLPIAWLASKFEPYQIDGDAVAYMDIADLLHARHWHGAVNGYWHPLYPACLALGQMLLHPTRWNELSAYYAVNYAIFLAQVVAILAFVTALDRLRTRMNGSSQPLLTLNALRLLGVGLLVIASQRELSMGKVRPDALLQALMLAAFAMLLQTLASDSLWFAPLMGLFFGLAYLTKSFAFLVALLSIAVMMLFQAWIQRRKLPRVAAGGALALAVFAAVAGPYIAALSHKNHRLDFGDSGALNYAWFAGGTEKLHMEPWQMERFGSASIHLVHPETQLLASPGIYSYRAVSNGTYPAWFDVAYFDERIVPHLDPHALLHRDERNLALVLRYLLNHPEAWLLLILLLVFGARFSSVRRDGFWVPMVLLGLAMWLIYGVVNIEERYVTLAYLVVLLPVFAALELPEQTHGSWLPRTATAMIVLLAFLALGESLRTALEERRNVAAQDPPHTWYSKQIYGAAAGLNAIGVKPGDEIACMGTTACVYDHYWARLAEVRILTEIYNPDTKHLFAAFDDLPNRGQVIDIVRAQGAKVLVAHFDPDDASTEIPASSGWVRLGETDFYALPLNLPQPAAETTPSNIPWSTMNPGP